VRLFALSSGRRTNLPRLPTVFNGQIHVGLVRHCYMPLLNLRDSLNVRQPDLSGREAAQDSSEATVSVSTKEKQQWPPQIPQNDRLRILICLQFRTKENQSRE
jgi:hypothetical protein